MNPQTPAIPASKQLSASPKKTFNDLVKSPQFKSELADALPKHLTVDRFTRVLLTATLRNPRLLECTQESLFKAIFDAAAAGLEIDGRRAHAIPYRNNKKNCYECQLIIDYKGLVELAMRSGLVSSVHADVVCEGDVFEVDRGLIVSHKIDYKQPRAKPYAAYQLANSNGRMKQIRERIAKLARDAVRVPAAPVEREDGVRVVQNVDDNRLQLFFPGKPDDGMRAALKGRGFRWAPSVGAWQRQLNNAAIYAAECILKGN